MTIPLHHPHDFALSSKARHDNPFTVDLTADFHHESGATVQGLPGFYDGADTWKIRFAPTLEGQWQGRTRSSDKSLDGIRLEETHAGPNPGAKVHGLLGIDPGNPRRFAWSDGTPFVYLGFECDWLFSYHQADPVRARRDIARIAGYGFTCIVTNLYAHTGFSLRENDDPRPLAPNWIFAPPALYPFAGTNDAPDHARLNPAFFQDFDRLLAFCHERGVVLHLMLQVQNKHVNWPERRSAEDDRFWRYVVARCQAYGNVLWDVSKEAKNLWRQTGSHDYVLDRMRTIRDADAFGHLVTVHDVLQGNAGLNAPPDVAADFVTDQVHLQTPGRLNREAIRRLRLLEKPYVNVEYGYELGAESLKTYTGRSTTDGATMLLRTWAVLLAGAYPCYYYDNTSWDLVKFDPEPWTWPRYRDMAGLLASLPLNRMSADNELVDSGFCLAAPGEAYLALLPDGGDLVIDLTAVEDPGRLRIEWLEIRTGLRSRSEPMPDERLGGFLSRIRNPFHDASSPCVITAFRQ